MPAALNMAVEEALLCLHERGQSPPTLRLYEWEPPAISLGRFQPRPRLEAAACRRLGLEVVRRPTGGRAVLHLGDLTYAVVAGTGDSLPASAAATYRLLCAGLLAGLRALGVEAGLGRERAKPPRPEICFLRATACDIVHRGRKLVGSAQTWRGSSLLQHGSIALEPQAEALAGLFEAGGELRTELCARTTSLTDILGRRPKTTEVGEALQEGLACSLGVEFEAGELSSQEWALACRIATGRWPEELGSHPGRAWRALSEVA